MIEINFVSDHVVEPEPKQKQPSWLEQLLVRTPWRRVRNIACNIALSASVASGVALVIEKDIPTATVITTVGSAAAQLKTKS